MERRLTTILAADVVGYSRLMGDDEAGTLTALKTLRRELVKPKEIQYGGRTVKLMGDGALMEFASVVDAVTFAVEVQAAMAERNQEVPEDRRIVYRMGINIGDIIVEGDDIYGDGVNIAARLEGLADPGGICISRSVHTQIAGKLDLEFEDLGEQQVKNIAKPVMVYRVALDERAAALVTPITVTPPTTGRGRGSQIAAGLVFSLVVVAGLVWWQPWAPDVEPASVEAMAFPLPDKPSIAVLPFDNLSGDPKQDYFTDGITEDIITGLSRFPDLFVVARNSTFSYKGQQFPVRQVAEELGVRYVLEGSVQKAADTIRVTAQLIDATTGHHIWAESYDRQLTDVFAVRDEVTQTIIATVMGDTGQLTRAEIARVSRKAPESLRAYELVLKGVDIWLRFTPEANREAAALFEKAIALDPGYARAHAVLAWVHLNDFRWLWSEDPQKSLLLAYEMARKSVELDDTDDWSHWALGVMHLYRREYAPAEAAYRKALEINPNYADLLAHSGLFLTFLGKPDDAIGRIKTAMRLNPYYRAWYPSLLGWVQYLVGDYDAAVTSLKEAIDRNPDFLEAYQHLAATYARLGRTDQARDEIGRIVQMNPDISVAGIASGLPFKNTNDLERYLEGLRLAGLPEEPPLPLPDKPSIAVLPFTNMSDDPGQDYFADGMTDDLITDLSKLSGLFVIARNSSFSYKGQQVKVRQVAEELGVRYVLEGSVRRAGDEVRINAQLIDATTGGHLWADRYDGTLKDIFGLQDDITARIVAALAVHLTASEQTAAATRDTDNVAAYDAFLQGWALFNRQTSEDFAKAIAHFEKAIELDPDYGRAYGALALTYHVGSDRGLSRTLDVPWYLLRHRARKYLDLAMKNPSSVAHIVASLMSLRQRLFSDAVMHIERAVALDPNNAEAHSMMAYVLVYDGRPEQAIEYAERAMRLDPNNPSRPLQWIGRAQFAKGDLEAALTWLDRARKHNPSVFPAALVVASARAHLGQTEEAQTALDIYMKNWSNPPPLKRIMYFWPFKDAAVAERFAEGVLKAGLPDVPGQYYQVTEKDRLSGVEIAALLFGRTISGYGLWDDMQWSREFGRDGEVVWHGPSVETDTGFSRIRGDQLCENWETMNEGYETCFPVFRYPKGTSEKRDEFLFMTDTGIYSWSLVE